MDITLEQAEELSKGMFPLYGFMDLKIEQMSDGVFRARVPFIDNNKNHMQTMAAPIQWAIAEMLGGLVWFVSQASDKHVPIMKSMNIDFLKPATSDIIAETVFTEADVQIMKEGLAKDDRYDFELKAVVKDSNDVIVSETVGQYAIRRL